MVVILRYMPIRGHKSRAYGFQRQQQFYSWCATRRIGTSTTSSTSIITKRPSFIRNHGHFPICYRHQACHSTPHIFRPLSSLPSSLDQSSLQDPVLEETSTLEENEDHTVVYEELKRLSMEIRRHDELYYNNGNNNNNNNNNTDDSSVTTISDDEYDALVQREAILCQKHPKLLQKWQDESGWGIAATRFGGRVGAAASSPIIMSSSSSSSTANGDSTPMQLQQQQQQPRRLEHLDRMLSLDNVESNEQLLAWLKRVYKKLLASTSSSSSSSSSSNSNSDDPAAEQHTMIITLYTEPKLDGLSLSLRYQYNKTASGSRSNDDDDAGYDLHGFTRRTMTLQWAATRGDGRQGQDVTAAVLEGLVLQNNHDGSGGDRGGSIPASIEWTTSSTKMPLPDILEVRGEVILPQSAFLSFLALSKKNQTNSNSSTTPLFSNARNAASGILLRKLITKETIDDNDNDEDDDEKVDENKQEQISRDLRKSLRFYAYDVVMDNQGKNDDNNQNSSSNTTSSSSTTRMNNGDATSVTNGLEARQWLQAHGFQVASPIAVTHLTLNSTTTMTSSSSSNGNDDSNTSFTPTSFWTKSDITPMLEYHDKLGQHRKNGSKDDDSLTWSWGDYEMDGKSSSTPYRYYKPLFERAFVLL